MKTTENLIMETTKEYYGKIQDPSGNEFGFKVSTVIMYKEDQYQKVFNCISDEIKTMKSAVQDNFNLDLTVTPEQKQLNPAEPSSNKPIINVTPKTPADKEDRKATDRQLNMVRGILVGLNRPIQEFLNGHKLNSEEEITNRHVAELKEEVQRLKLENPNLNVF